MRPTPTIADRAMSLAQILGITVEPLQFADPDEEDRIAAYLEKNARRIVAEDLIGKWHRGGILVLFTLHACAVTDPARVYELNASDSDRYRAKVRADSFRERFGFRAGEAHRARRAVLQWSRPAKGGTFIPPHRRPYARHAGHAQSKAAENAEFRTHAPQDVEGTGDAGTRKHQAGEGRAARSSLKFGSIPARHLSRYLT